MTYTAGMLRTGKQFWGHQKFSFINVCMYLVTLRLQCECVRQNYESLSEVYAVHLYRPLDSRKVTLWQKLEEMNL